MPENILPTTIAEGRFEQVLAEILRNEEEGTPIDLEQAVQTHPDLESSLREYFRNRARFEKWAGYIPPTAPPRTVPDLPTGSRIDCYEIIEEIDRGGRGIVYRVRDAELNRSLAVKVLLPKLRDDADAVRRFLEERQVTGQLQHPGIVPVHSVGNLRDGRPYFAMKLVQGRTLAALLAERGLGELGVPATAGPTALATGCQTTTAGGNQTARPALADAPGPPNDLPRFLGIFQQICQAVAYAHSRGVIHRDLKPNNVMVGSFVEVQVMDWGLAKVLANAEAHFTGDPNTIHTVRTGATGVSTADGMVAGTYAFMSSEQAKGQVDRIDERADVFGLGAVLCEILTGLPPYTGASALELYKRAAAGDLADAFHRLDHSGSDAELIALAKDCLAAERDARPRNAGVVAQRLSTHLANVQERLHKAELERAAAEARAREERRRRRWQGTAALIALLFLAAGAGVIFWVRQRSTEIEQAAREHLAEARQLSSAHRYHEAQREASQAEEIAHSGLASEGLRREIIDLLAELRDKANQEITQALDKATHLRDEALAAVNDPVKWAAAMKAANQAERLTDRPDVGDGLRQRARDLVADLEAEEKARRTVARLEAVRARRAGVSQGHEWQYMQTDPEVSRILEEYGVKVGRTEPTTLSAMLSKCPQKVKEALFPALDDWIIREPDATQREWLLAAVRAVDSDPWRNRARATLAMGDLEAMRSLAQIPELARQPPATAVLLGDAIMNKGAASIAADFLRAARQEHPDDYWLNHKLGVCLSWSVTAKDIEEAIRYLTAATSLRPDDPAAWSHLADALTKYGRFSEAEAAYRKAIDLQPDLFVTRYNFGYFLKERRRYADAEVVLRKALKLSPNHAMTARTHVLLGNVLQNQRRTSEALALFREAIDLGPDRETLVSARYQIGCALYDAKQWPDAMQAFRLVLDLQSNHANSHYMLGKTLFEMGRKEEAAACYRQAIIHNSNFEEAYNNLGIAYRALDKWEDSVEAFRRALKINRRLPQANLNLGDALFPHPEHWDEAITAFETSIQLNFHCLEACLSLGYMFFHRQEWDKGIAINQKAIELSRDCAEAHCNLGLCLCGKGEFRAAIEALRRGHEVGSSRPDWTYPSAHWLRDAERLLNIEQRLNEILTGRIQPANNDERLLFARLCHIKREYEAAAQFYEKALADLPKSANTEERASLYCAAAFNAAVAGCSQGGDSAKLDDHQRANRRRQALDWIRSSLALRAELLDAGDRKAQGALEQLSDDWRACVLLRSVREKTEMAKLPDDERANWEKLWTDLAALKNRVRETK
jgi:serine/threonine-protein kinase